ncbi:MAG: ABC transporter ATP-binding protein [Bacillota bacterium]|jgi:ATP-binding cassette subfamily B multidrug efflux pump|nr:ABC transporter ATP-binding protein [Bacillota bacterium]HOA78682.1 ABC transporter ATP-binding protein [Bacilli bacterium]HPZ27372.1 ABC transporter ATP-binding protein [Bacilli bacterium]
MFSMFKKIWWYIKANWLRYVLAITFLNLASLASVIAPKLLEAGIDKIVNKTITKSSLLALFGMMIAVTVGGYLISWLWNYLLFGASIKLEYTIRRNYFRHLLKMDSHFFDKNSSGDLMTRATVDLNAIAMTAGYGILTLVDSVVYLIMILFMMMYTISFKLTIIVLIPIVFIGLGVKILGEKIHAAYAQSQIAFGEMNNLVLESIIGIRVTKAYVQEHAEIEKLKASGANAYRKNNRLVRINALFDPLFRAAFTAASAIAFGVGAYLVFRRELTPGQLVSFVVYLGMLGWPMFALGDLVNIMSRGNASYDRIDNIMSQTPEVKEPAAPVAVGPTFKKLEFRDVTFAYPGSEFPAVENISFTLEKGKTLGIVGKTGSGKTTIIRLLLKQYCLRKGEVAINGVNIKDIAAGEVRGFFGYVPQEHILFSGAIYKNIAFGKENAGAEEIGAAAAAAAFQKDLETFDDGLDTVVGEHGVTLSGGQKQRLAIARALISDPEILILDDSLSAVDGTTEAEILQNLKKARKGKSAIIVAHRLTAVERADEIIVMDNGRIAERGSHEELMKLGKWYYRQYTRQQLTYKTGVEKDDPSADLEIRE